MIALLLGVAQGAVWAVDHVGRTLGEDRVRWESRMLVAEDHDPIGFRVALRDDDRVSLRGATAIVDDGWLVGVVPTAPFVTLVVDGPTPLVAGDMAVQQVSVAGVGWISSAGPMDPDTVAERFRMLGRPLVVGARFASPTREPWVLGLAGLLAALGVVADRSLERAARRERVRVFLAQG